LFEVLLKKQPQKFLDKLPEPSRGKLDLAIKGLEELSGDICPLRGAGRNMYRLKIYHYRAIFEIDLEKGVVTVQEINTRGDIY
jgi:toxin-antitoxin system, toxin component, relE family